MAKAALEMLLILMMILVNGWLSLSEMAFASSRRARLQKMAGDGIHGARKALEMLASPSEYLAAVQVGITMVGIASGALGGATLTTKLAAGIDRVAPALANWSEPVAFAVIVVAITVLTLVVGELVPKRMALAAPEARAAKSAGGLSRLVLVTRPAVRLLAGLTDSILRALRVKENKAPVITGDEVRILVEQGTAAGIFDKSESTMIKRVLRLDELRVDAVMTPRVKVIGLDLDDPVEENKGRIIAGRHLYYPLYRGEWNDLAGVVAAKDVAAALIRGETLDLKALARTPLLFAESLSVARALDRFKQAGSHCALVIDEFGTVSGLLTLTDALEAVVGEIPDEQGAQPECARRADGSWLIDGRFPLADLPEVLAMRGRILQVQDAQTLGGLVMNQLGRIPKEGDRFTMEGYRFEVVDMDGRRVDKVLVARHAKDKSKSAAAHKQDAAAATVKTR